MRLIGPIPELGVRPIAGDGDRVPLLAHIDQARPPMLDRVWTGKGRNRKSSLTGLTNVAEAMVLHLAWFHAPTPRPNRTRWLVLAVATALGVIVVGAAGAIFLYERISPRFFVYLAGGAGVGFASTMAAYHKRRVGAAQRAIPRHVVNVHGLIAMEDALLVRYPSVTYEIPRERIEGFRVTGAGDAIAESATAEFAFVVDVRADDGHVEPLLIDEVVDSSETALDQTGKARLAILYAATDWLNDTWRPSKPKRPGYRDQA